MTCKRCKTQLLVDVFPELVDRNWTKIPTLLHSPVANMSPDRVERERVIFAGLVETPAAMGLSDNLVICRRIASTIVVFTEVDQLPETLLLQSDAISLSRDI